MSMCSAFRPSLRDPLFILGCSLRLALHLNTDVSEKSRPRTGTSFLVGAKGPVIKLDDYHHWCMTTCIKITIELRRSLSLR